MATWLGLDTSLTGIQSQVKVAACQTCLTPRQQLQEQTYLFAVSAGLATDSPGVAAIEAAAKCFDCPTTKEQYELQVYILAGLALVSPNTPSSLMAASKCFQSCLPTELEDALTNSLIIQVGNRSTPPCVTPTAPNNVGAVTTSSTNVFVSWQQASNSGSLIMNYTIKWGTASGVYTNSFTTPGATIFGNGSFLVSGLTPGTTYFFVVIANSFTGCSSANSAEVSATTSGGAAGPCAAGTTFATNWANRVVANGGAMPSAATQTAISNFWCGLITDGLDSQMIQVNVFAPDSLIAASTQQLNLFGGSDPWTNHNFVLADIGVNGITGNAANKFFDTGFSIPGGFNDSFGVVVYNYTANASGFDYGGYNGTDGLLGAGKHTDTNSYSYSGHIATNAITVASPGNGYYSAQRISNTDHRLYFANSGTPHAQIGATDAAARAVALGGTSQYIMAANLSGATQFICSNTISFVAFTTGLVAADSAKLFLRVQTLLTALGRGLR